MSLRFNKFRRHPVIRAIALLFLVYTAIDIGCPELCRGEPLADDFTLTASTKSERETSQDVSIAGVNEQGKETPAEPCGDEDCFCCCAHVIPTPITVSLESFDASSPDNVEKYLVNLTPALPSEFHPPRFV